MRETVFTHSIIGALRSVNALTLKVHGHAMQQPGWPDLQVYHVRWSGHLELKVGRNQLTAAQRIIMEELNRRGAPAFVLRGGGSTRAGVPTFQAEAPDGTVLAGPGPLSGGARLLDLLHDLSRDAWSRIRSQPLSPVAPSSG